MRRKGNNIVWRCKWTFKPIELFFYKYLLLSPLLALPIDKVEPRIKPSDQNVKAPIMLRSVLIRSLPQFNYRMTKTPSRMALSLMWALGWCYYRRLSQVWSEIIVKFIQLEQLKRQVEAGSLFATQLRAGKSGIEISY